MSDDPLTPPGPAPEPSGGADLDRESPWPGLESFREEDTAFFLGRSEETDSLLRHVRRGILTVLYGFSGLGKSSLLRAGVFPRLRDELVLPVYIRLGYDEELPDLRTQVLNAVAEEAARHGIQAPAAEPDESLWEHFHRKGRSYRSPDNRPVTPLLAFDQFEEAFTLGRATPERTRATAAFLEELGDLIEGRTPLELKGRLERGEADPRDYGFRRHMYKILLAVREDFLGELETLKESIPSLQTNRMGLRPLDGRAALDVTQAGGPELIPPEVGEAIVRSVAGESPDREERELEELVVDPAILSLFCRELNERRKAQGRAAIEGDLVAGTQEEILSDFYHWSFEGLDPGVRRFVEEHLLTASGDYRQSQAVDDALRHEGVTDEAIRRLVQERRLLRIEERSGTQRIELTHDVLTGIVRASRDVRRHEEEQAERRRRDEQERKRQEEERRRQEKEFAAQARMRRALAVGTGALVLLVGASYMAWVAWDQTRAAEAARDLAAQEEARADSAWAAAEEFRLEAEGARERAREAELEAIAVREIADDMKRLLATRLADVQGDLTAFITDLERDLPPPPRLARLQDLGLEPGEAALSEVLREVAAETSVSGTLDEGRFYDAWLFRGSDARKPLFYLRASEGLDSFEPYLHLFDATDGSLLAQEGRLGPGLGARIDFEGTGTRSFVIVAGSESGRRTGGYELVHGDTVEAVVEEDRRNVPAWMRPRPERLADLGLTPGNLPPDLPVLEPDSEVSGTLDEGRLLGPWAFRGTAGNEGAFYLGSEDFDAYLYLFDGTTGARVDWDDDGGVGLDSFLEYTFPSTGPYVVVAGSFGRDETGAYTLAHGERARAMAFRPVSEDLPAHRPGSLEEAGLVPGALPPDLPVLERDSRFEDSLEEGRFAAPWLFHGTEGELAEFYMYSGDLDAYLYVYHGDTGELLAFDDDGGLAPDAFIEVSLPETGVYVVLAGSFGQDEVGAYVLAHGEAILPLVEEMHPELVDQIPDRPEHLADLGLVPGALPDDLPALERDERVEGVLDERRFLDPWLFQGEEGETVRLYMASDEVDAYLYLFDGETGELVTLDDDGGVGIDSFIEITLPATRLYVAVAGSFGRNEVGAYELAHGEAALRMRDER